MKRIVRGVTFLAAGIVTNLTATAANAATIDLQSQASIFNFLDQRNENKLFSAGLHLSVGANLVPNPPVGPSSYPDFALHTQVKATQGTEKIEVPWLQSPALPTQFFTSIPFDQNLLGSWTLTATNAPQYQTSTFQTAPVATNLLDANNNLILGSVRQIAVRNANTTTPELSWKLPDVAIPSDMILFSSLFVYNKDGTIIGFSSVPANNTSWVPLPADLQMGQKYVVSVQSTLFYRFDAPAHAGMQTATNRTFIDLQPSSTLASFPGPVYLPLSETTSTGPVFKFDIDVTAGNTYNLDPLIAIGYIFETGLGDPNFASVNLPDIGNPNPFELFLWDGDSFEFETFLNPNTRYDFLPGGVSRFKILGIDPSLMLDPFSTTAFVTQLMFVRDGTFTGTMTPVVAETPLPGALPLFATGLGVMGFLNWRRKRKTATVLRAA